MVSILQYALRSSPSLTFIAVTLSGLLFAATALAGARGTETFAVASSSSLPLVPPISPCKEDYHQLTIAVTTDAQNVADGDALWDSHLAYIKSSHRSFLVAYSLTKGEERSNPLDPGSPATGRTTYVLNECYRTSQDIALHWSKTSTEWTRFVEIIAWMQRPGTQVVTLHDGLVRNALWQLNDIL